jgi:S-adenosylmethionine:tRNA ribosyltransferase-isomerase
VSADLAGQLQRAKAENRPVIAVGTTVVRALESAAREGVAASGSFDTQLLISPGYRFQIVDALLTNFHAPRSTLLALAFAFAGTAQIRAAYATAIARGYRFLSYGDAMWIPPHSS